MFPQLQQFTVTQCGQTEVYRSSCFQQYAIAADRLQCCMCEIKYRYCILYSTIIINNYTTCIMWNYYVIFYNLLSTLQQNVTYNNEMQSNNNKDILNQKKHLTEPVENASSARSPIQLQPCVTLTLLHLGCATNGIYHNMSWAGMVKICWIPKDFLQPISASWDLDSWPPDLQCWPFHARALWTTCANLHQNQLLSKYDVHKFGNAWTDARTNNQVENNTPPTNLDLAELAETQQRTYKQSDSTLTRVVKIVRFF